MKKTMMIILLATMVIPGIADENIITRFLPDSLTTWQVALQLSGNTYSNDIEYGYRTRMNETLVNKSNESMDNYNVSISPGINFYYRFIRPKREMSCYLTAEYDYDKSWRNSANDRTYDDPDPNLITKEKYSNETVRPLLSANLTYDEYLLDQFGVSLIGNYFNNSVHRNSLNNNKSWETYRNCLYRDRERDVEYNHVSELAMLTMRLFHGRVYDGRYAAKAMEIIDQLKKTGALKNELTETEFNRFARIVMKHMASYHYDYRIKTIEALSEIYDYLTSIDALDSHSSSPFAIVQDVYLNNPLYTSREFGTRFYFNLAYKEDRSRHESDILTREDQYRFYFNDNNVPVIDSLLDENEEKHVSNSEGISWIPSVEIGVDHNSILNWHVWYESRLALNYSSYSSKYVYTSERSGSDHDYANESSKRSENQRIQVTLGCRLNYQMNSRSYIYLSASSGYTNIKSDIKNSDYEKVENLNESIFISIMPGYQYYITPKISFRISGTASLYQYFTDRKQGACQYKNDFRQINSSLNFGFMMYL